MRCDYVQVMAENGLGQGYMLCPNPATVKTTYPMGFGSLDAIATRFEYRCERHEHVPQQPCSAEDLTAAIPTKETTT